jgi:Septin
MHACRGAARRLEPDRMARRICARRRRALRAVQIQDTPGYGDDLDINNNISRIKRHIDEQNQKWHKMESHPKRGTLNKEVDPRVDLCLFCLPPHRVRNIDLLFMYEVGKVRAALCSCYIALQPLLWDAQFLDHIDHSPDSPDKWLQHVVQSFHARMAFWTPCPCSPAI